MVNDQQKGVVPARTAHEQGLTRIVDAMGRYGTRNYTVKGLRDQKGQRVLVETLAFTPDEAAAAETAGIDTMKVRFDPQRPDLAVALRQAAPHTFMSYAVQMSLATSEETALKVAFAAMDAGADSLMCQWSPRFISAVAEAGIPIQGHAGLVPRKSTWTGGLRAVGKTFDEAMWVFQEIQALEAAGAWGVEIEVIPAALLTEISARTTLITSSIGAGGGGDIQFLFAQDILGDGEAPFPRHSKQYRDMKKLREALQAERVGGFEDFIADVKAGTFPAQNHIVNIDDDVLRAFIDAAND